MQNCAVSQRQVFSHYTTYYTAFLPVCQEVFDNFPKLIRQHICCQNILTLQHICCFHQSSKRHRVCATLGLRPQLAQFVQCGRSRAIWGQFRANCGTLWTFSIQFRHFSGSWYRLVQKFRGRGQKWIEYTVYYLLYTVYELFFSSWLKNPWQVP